jgi:LacI family transcriptional regulator
MTIVDVAKKAGVSIGTVSAVLNAKTTVKPETREKVLKLMKEYSFRPKGISKNLKYKPMDNSIGIIIRDLDYPYYTSIAQGAKEYATRKGYSVIITSSDDNHESEKNLLNLFATKAIKGLIIAPVSEETAEVGHLFKLKMINCPFVLLEDVKGIQTNVVTIDKIRAVKKAVQYLIDSGHTKIVYFTDLSQSLHNHEGVEGFILAFSESTLVFNKDMVVAIGSGYNESFKKTLNYFKNKNKKDYPTAVVCFNDNQALAVMSAFKKLNIKVPDDISIVGNDGIYDDKLYPVPLTTTKAPLNKMGMKAAEILIRNIESTEFLPEERVIFNPEFVVRKSTKIINPVEKNITGKNKRLLISKVY